MSSPSSRWLGANQLLNAVWPWAQKQRWAPKSEATLKALHTFGANAFLIAEAEQRLYCLPLALRGCECAGEAIYDSGNGVKIIDGASDESFVDAWVAECAEPLAAHSGEKLPASAPIKPLGGEQSNSSVRRAGVMIKFFRSPIIGTNPEVSVSNALWEQGFANIPAPVAASKLALEDGEITTGYAAAMINEAEDGFVWASQCADPFEQLQSLGAVTAQMHRALAAAFGIETVCFSPAERILPQLRPLQDVIGASLSERLTRVVDNLPKISGPAQRIHGDYHLGQCLLADKWYLLDFEGEPLRPLAQRIKPDLAQRDVAGMLRSISYAAALGKFDQTWLDRSRAAYLEGYGEYDRVALACLEIEKALYEVRYEATYRPDWVQIPLRGLESACALLEQDAC